MVATDDRAAAAVWVDEHVDDGTVSSRWNTYRLYKYHATEQGESYAFAAEQFAPVVRGDRLPPERVAYVVERDRLPSGYAEGWHVGTATRVWQQGDISVYEVNPSSAEE